MDPTIPYSVEDHMGPWTLNVHTIQDNTRPYTTKQDHKRLYMANKTIQDHMGPKNQYRTIQQNHTKVKRIM